MTAETLKKASDLNKVMEEHKSAIHYINQWGINLMLLSESEKKQVIEVYTDIIKSKITELNNEFEAL